MPGQHNGHDRAREGRIFGTDPRVNIWPFGLSTAAEGLLERLRSATARPGRLWGRLRSVALAVYHPQPNKANPRAQCLIRQFPEGRPSRLGLLVGCLPPLSLDVPKLLPSRYS